MNCTYMPSFNYESNEVFRKRMKRAVKKVIAEAPKGFELKSIAERHEIISVSCAGPTYCFDSSGYFTEGSGYKYKVEYRVNGFYERIWLS